MNEVANPEQASTPATAPSREVMVALQAAPAEVIAGAQKAAAGMSTEIQALPTWTAPSDLAGAKTAIRALGRSMHEHAYLLGKILSWTKGEVGHGHFKVWLTANTWFSERTAQRFMSFAEKCEAQGSLLTYSPGGKHDIMSDLSTVPMSGIGGLALKVIKSHHENTMRLLAEFSHAQDKLTALINSRPVHPKGTPEWAVEIANRSRAFDALIVDDEGEGGEIPTMAGQILMQYGKFLITLNAHQRQAFEKFETDVLENWESDGLRGEIISNFWAVLEQSMHETAVEVGIRLSIAAIGIGRQGSMISTSEAERVHRDFESQFLGAEPLFE